MKPKFVIEARNVTAGYGRATIIEEVDLTVENGKLTAMVGPNGSGKSTFLKTLVGFTTLFKGSVLFEGKDVTTFPPEGRVRMGIGYVPQVDNIFPTLSVKESLEIGAYTRRNGHEVRSDMEEVMGMFPILKERQDQKAGTLSGGERQMLAVARALMSRPTVLLLDEPAAALAPKVAARMFSKIQEIVDLGVTVVLVEQHAKRALEMCDMGYVMTSGRVAMKGTGKQLLSDESFVETFLGGRRPS